MVLEVVDVEIDEESDEVVDEVVLSSTEQTAINKIPSNESHALLGIW